MKKLFVLFAFTATGFCAKAQLNIGNGGNVGIGINVPTHKLHVIRNSYFDGTHSVMISFLIIPLFVVLLTSLVYYLVFIVNYSL